MTSYRKPLNEYAKHFISKLYALLVEYEKTHSVDESVAFLQNYLDQRGLTYDQFIDRLSLGKSVANVTAMNLDYKKYLNSHVIFKARYIDTVKNGKKKIAVQNKHDCELGRWLDTVQNESFANTPAWRNILKNHEQTHTLMEQYIHGASTGASEAMLETYLKQADDCTEALFNSLIEVIDNSEE
ncbi:MAG: CZB domain-containing protein [Campylobacterota bacterium]|nr:CZB domain-containing protein [Campylobacterota bacterium]